MSYPFKKFLHIKYEELCQDNENKHLIINVYLDFENISLDIFFM